MTSIAVKVSDALRAVSITKKVSTIDVASMVTTIGYALRARLRAQSQSGHADDEEHDHRHRAPERGDRAEFEGIGENEDEEDGDRHSSRAAEPTGLTEDRGDCASSESASVRLPAAKTFELTEDAVASSAVIAMIVNPCVSQHGPCGLCKSRVAVLDHLVHRQCAEDSEADRDVHERGDTERQIHRARERPSRVREVPCRESDDREAEVCEERQRDGRDDLAP